ncbi:glycosyl transferase family 2 [Halomicroarcula limicola]|uniref:Glycosyl transferase family 2 n=1 Tax=Haloarcula limicola TaxID=1429915 RepID=A0A8J7Y266_9EURY|nr:glycosyl transferase family 2 [Halomicroarcula limicola]MBV0923355.1 glycosyl transferase family 2 [Halomicroarcula limicola]
MDYAQERITTLHDLTDPTPDAPVAESAVVVPIAGETEAAVTPAHVFETLAAVGPSEVVVPLRAPREVALAFREWASEFAVPVTVLWCDSPPLETLLDDRGLGGGTGKGRDVWLGLGVAASRADYVAVHDADATTYAEKHVPRLLAPLTMGHEFVKGYYARVEDDRLYGRLARLFVAPLLRALEDRHTDPLLGYLSAFRYPLAGEFAVTADAARRIRAQRAWGLELGMLGETYSVAGETGTAQVDLGIHRHDHRPVGGRGGLSTMATEVGEALFRALEDGGVAPNYGTLPDAYRTAADRYIKQYAADAAFNGLDYDPDGERAQISEYEESIRPPGPDDRLPAWVDAGLAPSAVVDASRDALERRCDSSLD